MSSGGNEGSTAGLTLETDGGKRPFAAGATCHLAVLTKPPLSLALALSTLKLRFQIQLTASVVLGAKPNNNIVSFLQPEGERVIVLLLNIV